MIDLNKDHHIFLSIVTKKFEVLKILDKTRLQIELVTKKMLCIVIIV